MSAVAEVVAVATATYLGAFVPMGRLGVEMTAVASIAALTWINARGVSQGAFLSNVLTLIKILAALLLVALAFGAGKSANLSPVLHAGPLLPVLAPFGLAMVAALCV